MKRKVYQILASHLEAYKLCVVKNNKEWEEKHADTVNKIIDDLLPHGSGINAETEISFKKSGDKKIVLYTEFQAMDNNGYYDKWIGFSVTITPSLSNDISLSIVGNFGSKYQHIKDYLYDLYYEALKQEVEI
jgi:hypothetical protein